MSAESVARTPGPRLLSRAAARVGPAPRGILCYHSVDDSGSSVSTSPAQLRQHLDALAAAGYRFVALGELVGAAGPGHGGRTAPLLSLTFDDGYRNNLEVALPILEEYRCPATFFVVSGWAGQTLNAHFPALPDLPLMDRREWRLLARHPLASLGVHSHTHPRLPELPPERVEAELSTCRKLLEPFAGAPPTLLAYPHGAVSAAVVDVARRLGFEVGCTIRPPTSSRIVEPLLAPRIRVRPATTALRLLAQLAAPRAWLLLARMRRLVSRP